MFPETYAYVSLVAPSGKSEYRILWENEVLAAWIDGVAAFHDDAATGCI